MKSITFRKITFPLLIFLGLSIFIHYYAFLQSGMYPTHDGEIHLIRSLHFQKELLRGQLPVRMVPEQAYYFGYAVFQFFYPLPYYITSVFQLIGFSTTTSWKLQQLFATFASLSIFYVWIKKHTKQLPALIATIIWALVPFRFVTLYVTGQAGGYYGFVFAPLLALGLYNIIKKEQSSVLVKSALSLAIFGFVTSHLLSAIIFSIPLGLYTIFLLHKNYSKKTFFSLVRYTLLGLGLASFYLIPFLLELRWIRLGHSVLIDYTQHWPTLKQLLYSPWGYGHSNSGPNDGMSYQIGFAILATVFGTTILATRKIKNKKVLVTFLGIFAVLFFLVSPYSTLAWKIFVPLQLIQFPWRLLVATSFIGAALAGILLNSLPKKVQIIAGLFLVLLGWYNIRNYTRPWPIDWRSDQEFKENEQAYYGPTDISWELMPITARRIHPSIPEYIPVATTSAVTVLSDTKLSTGSIVRRVELETQEDQTVEISVWKLPVWQMLLDRKEIQTKYSQLGTIQLELPAGKHTLEQQLVKTTTQKVADTISVITLLLWVVLLYKSKNTNRENN